MIRRILASLLPLLIAAPLMAQTMVGFRAGLSRSTFYEFLEDELAEFEAPGAHISEDPRMGVAAGVDVAFPVGGPVELRFGGAYAQKGYSLSGSGPGGSASTDTELDYLQFSALARVGTLRDGPLSVGVLLGPWAAFRLSCTLRLDLDVDLAGFDPIDDSASCTDDLRTMDFGIAAGGGVELAVTDGLRLGLDVVYSIGLSRIDENPESPKNRSLTAQAGVVIPLGG